MFGLRNLIKPEFAVNLLRKELSKQLAKEVTKFSILFNAEKDVLSFFIGNEEFKSTEKQIQKIIAEKTKGSLAKGEKLDIVKIDIDKEIIASVYYQSVSGKKEFKQFKF